MSADDAFGQARVREVHSLLMRLKPDWITNEPPARSRQPLYGLLGPISHCDYCATNYVYAFRLDESQGHGSGYDELIVDFSGFGSLADDRPYKRHVPKQSAAPEAAIFGPLWVPVNGVGGWRPALYAQVTLSNLNQVAAASRAGPFGCLRARPAAYWEGGMFLGRTWERFAILDANLNLWAGDFIPSGVATAPALATPGAAGGDILLRDSGPGARPPLAGWTCEPFDRKLDLRGNLYSALLTPARGGVLLCLDSTTPATQTKPVPETSNASGPPERSERTRIPPEILRQLLASGPETAIRGATRSAARGFVVATPRVGCGFG